MEIVLGIILIIAAIFLVVAVLLQSGKEDGLSGAIAGGADTFFGKNKGKTMDKMLSRITTIVAIVFVILVIVIYVIQPNTQVNTDKWFKENVDGYISDSDADAGDTVTTVADAEPTVTDANDESAEG